MNKTAPKKMVLSCETLGTLTDSEMKEVQGAASNACSGLCSSSREVCCP